MEPSIQFGTYTPPEDNKNKIDLSFGVFFDGTANNKNNTDERRKNSAIFQKKGKNKKQDTSYYNDWSNVARLWDVYDFQTKIYVEGIGTEDYQKDETTGLGFGSGDTGIRPKVRKGCERIVKKMQKIVREKKTNKFKTLTLYVFGFSRGAAAARNFVYEIGKAKYTAEKEENKTRAEDYYHYIDTDGKSTGEVKNMPKGGHLGFKLQDAKIEVDYIYVRFLGIFDTVSSFHPKLSLLPNFSNDIEELNLNSLNKAKNIVHFTAENEHRENFALTRSPSGIEKSFPGVHSDIGGCYENGIELVEEIETSKTTNTKLEPLKKQLISECWYKETELEITGGNLYWALQGTRSLKKTYSYIPLHFMAEFGETYDAPMNKNKLVDKYSLTNDAFLTRIKERLQSYVFGKRNRYKFEWIAAIHEKHAGKPNDPNYQKELEEQKDLRELRNKYLHWSSTREGIGLGPTKDRKRRMH